jgi:hypothetical protein
VARQDANPPPWSDDMSDGCTGVLDRWFWVNLRDCCVTHDRRFHYGGTDTDYVRANEEFQDCTAAKPWCLLCGLVGWWRRKGVQALGRHNFNWLGPGDPEWR